MSADLRECLRLTPYRGPGGRLFFQATRNGRRFLMVEKRDGSWCLYERVGPPMTAAPSEARPRPTRRPVPKRLRRQLGELGLVQGGDLIEEAHR